MKHDADGQLDLLNQLLGNGLFERPGNKGYVSPSTEQKGESGRVDESGHPNRLHHGDSSVVETRPDAGREQRKGTPEIIFGETKETAQILAMAQGLLAGSGRAIVSRTPREALLRIQEAFSDYKIRIHEAARMAVIYHPDYQKRDTGGHVGVISAGTSDIPVAAEAGVIAEEMGCRITSIYDVGVAGLHRLVGPLRDLLADGVDVIIVAAGMDGALPSVVAGLVPVPVIGLPTSVGYGFGGNGVAALLSMLQTCAPGLSVVNIDNGVGAGITAGLIANRVAQARERQSR